MNVIARNDMVAQSGRFAAVAVLAGALAGCAQIEIAPHLRPLAKDTMMLLGKKGMSSDAPLFIRIFKEESELEVWKQRPGGHFYHFKTYPICNWSGELGPKTKQGDRQAPEGFYPVSRGQMKPDSQFHLAFNLGYPNIFDKSHDRTGDFLMVHGKCVSIGCNAMTDAFIEEIYALVREAFAGGQQSFQAHVFPFRMTNENIERHKGNRHYAFWQTLKEGYDHFETTRQVPAITVCERRYVVNVKWNGKIEPTERCPSFERPKVENFVAKTPNEADEQHVVVAGHKTRQPPTAPPGLGTAVGLTTSEPVRTDRFER